VIFIAETPTTHGGRKQGEMERGREGERERGKKENPPKIVKSSVLSSSISEGKTFLDRHLIMARLLLYAIDL